MSIKATCNIPIETPFLLQNQTYPSGHPLDHSTPFRDDRYPGSKW